MNRENHSIQSSFSTNHHRLGFRDWQSLEAKVWAQNTRAQRASTHSFSIQPVTNQQLSRRIEMSSNDNQNLGARELSYLLLGTDSSSSALPTTANSQTPLSALNRNKKKRNDGDNTTNIDDDVSGMDAAQASLLLKQKHGIGKKASTSTSTGGGGGRHYRLQNNKNRKGGGVVRDYHLGLQEFDLPKIRHGRDEYEYGEENEEDDGEGLFQIKSKSTKRNKAKKPLIQVGRKSRKEQGDSVAVERYKLQHQVEKKKINGMKDDDSSSSDSNSSDSTSSRRERGRGRLRAKRQRSRQERNRRRTDRVGSSDGSSSDSNTDSSSNNSSSSSDDQSKSSTARRRQRRNVATNRRSTGSDDATSSSSDSENEVSRRRDRARRLILEKRKLQEKAKEDEDGVDSDKIVRASKATDRGRDIPIKSDDSSSDSDSENDDKNNNLSRLPHKQKTQNDDKEHDIEDDRVEKKTEAPEQRKGSSNPSSDSDSSDSDDTTSSSSSSSSDSDSESDDEEPSMDVQSKPLFVPKHRRNKLGVTNQQRKLEEDEEYNQQQQKLKEKRIQSSRALVAQIVANENNDKNQSMLHNNGGDQNEFAETGGSAMPPPSDFDSLNEKDKMEQRDIWEVRELMRVLRDYEEFIHVQNEIKEKERRRNMTDEERFQEDVKSGKYRKPGEQRRKKKDEGDDGVYLKRFYHRGAFYMDEDTLNKDKNDVRHRAKEYAQAATGQEKVNMKAMPKVMQVKNFGMAGHSTKYKGLAKEDTTDRSLDYIPVNRSKKRRH